MMARELSAQLHFILKNYSVNPARQSQATQDDPYAQLAKLAQLRDDGVISADDFEAKKAELLRRI
jgi:membrane protease subunit (stomatin/prohibitin family)